MPKKKKGLIFSKSIDDLYPYTIEISKKNIKVNDEAIQISSKIACRICLDFSDSLKAEDIQEMKKYLRNNFLEIYEDLSIRIIKSEPKIWFTITDYNFHNTNNLSEQAYNILTDKIEALLNLKHLSFNIQIDDEGFEHFCIDTHSSLASLAKFVVYVLNNQLNWDFIGVGGE